ncbi:hypothetical protein [Halobacillus sp. KGW1]|uniref:hypothetical protein n=1 Tax=Halobacillus sp. KGW1 TaxID=1793726 RepID=UPI000783F97F|nr:hypothetical protein [Halobacillus sp. KGW1]
MYSIGIRVSPNKVSPKIYYTVILLTDGGRFDIVRSSELNIPTTLDLPEQLAYLRTNLLAIILEYNIICAGLRISETIAKTPSIYRMNIEGVIQELFANSSIEKYSVMKIAQMSKYLEDGDIKSYLDGDLNFAEIKDWDQLRLELRESTVTSLAATCI